MFPSTKGTPRYGSSIRKPMREVSEAIGLIRFGLQVLRRTFNTLMVNRGVPEGVVHSMMGHASSGMTRLYQNVQPEQQRTCGTRSV